MIELFNAALLANQNVLRGLRESPNVVLRGMTVLLFVGVLVGAVRGLNQAYATASPERIVETVRRQVDETVQQLVVNPNSEQSQPIIQLINQNEEAFYTLLTDLLTLPTPLPGPVRLVFQWLGSVVSTPVAYLAGLLPAVIFTQMAARQLGGQGSIQQMLGLGALSTAPHALDALTFIPAIGSTLGFIAWGWGLVILVVGTMVAHKLDSGRATMAVLLYPLIFGLLGLLALCALLFFSVALAAGG
jgi:Na+-transporting methylmalonyl-CoA/oxaloacetate decarboxylase gamma subunit